MDAPAGNFQLRMFTPSDVRGIAEVHVRTWQIAYGDYFSKGFLDGMGRLLSNEGLVQRANRLANPESITFVAEKDQDIVGFATVQPNQEDLGPEVGELGAIYVDPAHWNSGIGSALITAAESQLAASGFSRAILWTIGPNERTRHFYERHGWSYDGTSKPHQGEVELVRYAKRLTPGDTESSQGRPQH
ncbi:MAG: GNAT family N-acetyltransferase [Dehalococcoidia bacterium]|nr:GNAT family N-acetyltransferase [Dehalococcoidia bacterium]